MTLRKANQVAESLRMAFQVLFTNNRPAEMDVVTVTFCGTSKTARGRSFLFHIKMPNCAVFLVHELAHEIEKLVPNVRVTAENVYFFSRSMRIICKELGKTGTYSFDFVHVTA